mgnify:CR=1 FL=1
MTKNERIDKFRKLFSGLQLWHNYHVNLLIEELDYRDFFTAPASTKYHGAYEGGLFDHSYEVTMCLLELTEKMGLQWQHERSPYVIGMFHDLCKCDQYRKTADGWEYRKDLTLTGHGEKSVIMTQQFLMLSEEEILCIRWHMGAYDEKENWNSLGKAIEKYPNVLWTHTADMMASRIKGV